MKYFVLILALISFLNAGNFKRDNGKSVVVDRDNNLMWEDREENIKNYLIHEDAENYCKNLTLAGYSNWRLPDIEEFALIVDKNRYPKNIDKSFRFIDNTGYWAEKAHWRTLWFYADYMHFVSGTPYFDSRHKEKLVRCVRDIN